MKVYIVWQVVDDYPENGGGEYLEDIFLNYEKANKFLKERQKEVEEEGEEDIISYEIRPFEIEEE